MAERPTDPSSDWRRQRRGRGSRPSRPAISGEEPGTESELVTSRTLFSFLEPFLNVIGSFATPVVIAGVFALVVGISLAWFVTSLRPYGLFIIGFGVVMLGVITLIYLSTVFAAFISRTGRYGVNSLIMLAAFVGIIIIINIISFSNNSRLDTTATQQFSLATGSKNLLKDLDQPVRAIAFYRENFPAQDQQQIIQRAKVEDTLSEFSERSRQFTYEFRDPDIEPEIARKYGITFIESIVIEGTESGNFDVVQPTDAGYSQLEQDLYTSILVATGKEQRKVYFLAGHGERSVDGGGGDGYDAIRDGLERDNYRVEILGWNPTDEDVTVPDDTALLVIAGPTGELPEAHERALTDYLSGVNADGSDRREGARMIFLAEPDTPLSFRNFLLFWGVLVREGYILDLDRSVPGTPHTLRVGIYNPQAPREIVAPRGVPLGVSFMPGAASLQVIPDPGSARIPLPLAVSSTNSYLIDDIERTEPITDAGEDSDPTGLFFPGVYVQAVGPLGTPQPISKPPDNRISGLVVFGDSDFITNSFIDRGSGAALFLNSANYLLGDFSLVSIRDRRSVFREFNLDQNQFDFVRYSSWFMLPVLMGLIAGLVWWLRR
ncbi:MAG: Gldg family protein [Chloroflexi bacterium]|nr:Gldg family protein [Chloroflexota bacterium]